MVTDEELGSHLGARLHEETAGLRAPDGLAATVTRQRNRRRAWGYVAGAALPVVAGAVVLSVALAGGGGQPANHRPGTAQGDPRVHTVGYVTEQSQKALATIDQYVAHVTTSIEGQQSHESWSDAAGKQSRALEGPAGAPTRAWGIAIKDDQFVITMVNFADHTWSTDSNPLPSDKNMQGKLIGAPYGDPDEIRSDLASGNLELIGTEQVDGHTTEHLRAVIEGEAAGKAGMDLWVDTTTYLPVKFTGHKMDIHFAVAYEWLPRTGANAALAVLTVPDGYRQVEFAPENGGGGKK